MDQSDGSDFYVGVGLAVSSSLFIGTSFIVKKKGLRSSTGTSAGGGGHSYLLNPLWWTGLILMIVGEVANFVAYSFAPAIVVTPMGALSVVVSAILAAWMLQEHLDSMGKLGCALCLIGSTVIVFHAPAEHQVTSVDQIWDNILTPSFLAYLAIILSASAFLIVSVAPKYGTTHILVYLLICSMLGSLSVMSCKAVGIAIRLTLNGHNQFNRVGTWFFVAVVASCIMTQMNYLNKSLDLFNTARVTPIYYVFFTTFVIVASVILFKDWKDQEPANVVSQICGFLTVFIGIHILQMSKSDSSHPDADGFEKIHSHVDEASLDDDNDDEDDDDDHSDIESDRHRADTEDDTATV